MVFVQLLAQSTCIRNISRLRLHLRMFFLRGQVPYHVYYYSYFSPPSRLLHPPPSSRRHEHARSSAFLHRPHARIHTHTHTHTHTARYTCAWAPSSCRRWRSRSSAALAILSRISSLLPDVLAPPPQLWSPMLLPPPSSTAAETVAPGRCWAEGFWRMKASSDDCLAPWAAGAEEPEVARSVEETESSTFSFSACSSVSSCVSHGACGEGPSCGNSEESVP